MTTTDTPPPRYAPIGCAAYSQLELAILHHQRLDITWVEDNVIHHRVVTPLDLRTAKGEEFLVFRAEHGERLAVRLDYLRRVVPA